MNNKPETTDHRQQNVDNRQKTKDNRQLTTDNRQQTINNKPSEAALSPKTCLILAAVEREKSRSSDWLVVLVGDCLSCC